MDMLGSKAEERGYINILLGFSAQTSSLRTQETLEVKLEKKRKGVFGAPPTKKLIAFVDDVNMPVKEFYGAQPPIELLRQFLDFKGFYSRGKDLAWKNIEDLMLVAACGPPGGGRQDMTPRFVRHFNMLCIAPPSEPVLKAIFGSILRGFLETFPADVKALSGSIVDASVEVYTNIAKDLLPTPAKSHYTFNLRDLSKVVQGVLMIKEKNCPDAKVMTKLWMHESMRVFCDRLIDDQDRNYFKQMVLEIVKRKFSMELDFHEIFVTNPIIFGDYLKMGIDPADRMYELADLDKLPKLFNTYLDEYNSSNNTGQMELVFFKDCIEHISRICRVMRQPRGNAMLVGVGGSGKQSASRLACAMGEFEIKTIAITRSYGMTEFREDLKQMYTKAGAGKPLVFMLTDTQIVNESFLEDINNVLNSGDVPNLFPHEEVDNVLNDIRPYVQQLGLPETKDVMWATFINRVRDNLHIVLAMSPVGEALRRRCRMFPSLINCCTVDWYDAWPDDALLSVSSRFLNEIDGVSDPVIKKGLAKMCVTVHQKTNEFAKRFFNELRRNYYVTPKSYLDLISMYQSTLSTNRSKLEKDMLRLENGLNKLRETNETVEVLQGELAVLLPVLAEKSEATDKLVIQVSADQDAADKIARVVNEEALIVGKQADEANAIKADAQKDLDEALPALAAAMEALNSLNKNDITEMKNYTTPPALVQLVMDAVMIYNGEYKPDWAKSKKFLSDSKFIETLKKYDKDNIPEKTIKAVQKYIDNPDFIPAKVGSVSAAAKSLCMWARAMHTYHRVAKEVEPKKARLAEAEATLGTATAALKIKQDQLKEVTDKVAALKAQLQEAEETKRSLQANADLSNKRLGNAGKLTSALGDEAVRWKETVADLKVALELVVGNVFLGCACVSYMGAFTGSYRDELIKVFIDECEFEEVPRAGNFSLAKTLSDPVQIRQWAMNGLPADTVSVDNGIMVTLGKRWPLMIDPQSQANRWIKTTYRDHNIQVMRMGGNNFLRSVEQCVRLGYPLLIEEVGETLEASLEPLLLKQTFKMGSQTRIRLGDSDVDYDTNFRLFMTSKLPNPHYLPEVCIKITLINFTVTMSGLEDQLLVDVVRKERPELEAEKSRLITTMANDKHELHKLEDNVLHLLQTSEGNILDNVNLINTLNTSKLTSTKINQRVKEAEQTEITINTSREQYRSVATRGSVLYFVVSDLAMVDPMYQYSCMYFVRLFNYCMDISPKSDVLEERLKILINFVTEFIYINVCRGLFEVHKTMFSFLIASSIMRSSGKITPADWFFLLVGVTKQTWAQQPKNPNPQWITEKVWNHCGALEQANAAFSGLCAALAESNDAWQAWAAHKAPHMIPLPGEWDTKLNRMWERLLLMKVFREEKVLFLISFYVKEVLGAAFLEPPPFILAEVFKDSDCYTPIIFVLSSGADPANMLLKLAKDQAYSERLTMISLGQGQGPKASNLINKASKTGDWVCLQNCHLATSYMSTLEKLVESFPTPAFGMAADSTFRLWLTSMPSEDFPVPVLQNGIKLTNEPPKGIKANLNKTFVTIITEEYWEKCHKPNAWKKLMFACAFFHAIIQERRKFGPLGWNIRYDWNESDMSCSLDQLKNFLEEQDELPWLALVYVTGEINYGGRVTDDQDRRCLLSILGKYYVPKTITDDNYSFSSSGLYKAPPVGSLQSVRDYIKNLPITDEPEVFGMHDNANITFQSQETKKILDIVLELQPRLESGEGAATPDEVVQAITTEIGDGLPPNLNPEEALAGMFTPNDNGEISSLATVLWQEHERFNKLLNKMRSTLKELGRALKGLVVMSAELEKMYKSFTINQTPEVWHKSGYLCLKPLASWTTDLHRRIAFMALWLKDGPPKSFWLPGFFFPQGFMTGTLQTHARKYKIPIDTLAFSFKLIDADKLADVKDFPKDGVYIEGLYMESGRWNRTKSRYVSTRNGR
jgi:dynein heavy chain